MMVRPPSQKGKSTMIGSSSTGFLSFLFTYAQLLPFIICYILLLFSFVGHYDNQAEARSTPWVYGRAGVGVGPINMRERGYSQADDTRGS
jgi:hypothetical protein